MIELVIKISEEDYDTLINHNNDSLTATIARLNLWKALENAIAIPEGHGNLKDENELWNAYFKWDCDFFHAIDMTKVIIKGE